MPRLLWESACQLGGGVWSGFGVLTAIRGLAELPEMSQTAWITPLRFVPLWTVLPIALLLVLWGNYQRQRVRDAAARERVAALESQLAGATIAASPHLALSYFRRGLGLLELRFKDIDEEDSARFIFRLAKQPEYAPPEVDFETHRARIRSIRDDFVRLLA